MELNVAEGDDTEEFAVEFSSIWLSVSIAEYKHKHKGRNGFRI